MPTVHSIYSLQVPAVCVCRQPGLTMLKFWSDVQTTPIDLHLEFSIAGLDSLLLLM